MQQSLMNNYAVQPFRQDDEKEPIFFEIYKRILNQVIVDIDAMFNQIYDSSQVSKAVYDLEIFPIYKLISERVFVEAFTEILKAQEIAGSYNAYCQILYGIFGSNASITIDPINPYHIKIDIVARHVEYFVWVNEEHTAYITTEAGDYLGFASLVARITNRQLADILKAMTNAGVYLEFTYSQENPTTQNED